MPRPRAPKACLRCRARKVRCDVSISGIPCRNCDLDHTACTVAERMSKRLVNRDQLSPLANAVCSRLLTNNELKNASPTATILPQGAADKEVSQAPSELVWHPQLDMGLNSSPRQGTSRRASNLKGAQTGPTHLVLDMSPSTHRSQPPTEKTYGLDTLPMMTFPQYNGAVKSSTARTSQPTRLDCLQASDYPFIRLPDLSKMPSEDIDCLSLQGCLQLPPRLILDEFVRQYFLHVHPIMPLLDEAHFWDIYCDRLGDGPDIERIPMVLFQAMLFVSCSVR